MVMRGEKQPKGDAWKRATIGNAAEQRQYQYIWCEDCRHRVEVPAAELMRQGKFPPDTPFWNIAQRLVCGACGSVNVGISAASYDKQRDAGIVPSGSCLPKPLDDPVQQTNAEAGRNTNNDRPKLMTE